MTDNQVAHVRNFLETYAPTTTPQIVVKALDYISPSERFPYFCLHLSHLASVRNRDRDQIRRQKRLKQKTQVALIQMNWQQHYKNKIVFRYFFSFVFARVLGKV